MKLNGNEVKVAVAHGLSNAKTIMEKIKKGEAEYHFIEIMACPGGCIGGGGTPIVDGPQRLKLDQDYKELRIKAIYGEEKQLKLRKSHQNPAVKKLYETYLGKPLGEISHKLLHTHYKKRTQYPEC